MNERNLEVFVDGASRYFGTVTDTEAQVGTPFLIQDVNKYLLDYTGIIGISGNHKGSVFFSAPNSLLTKLIAQIGIITTQEEKLMDLVGEVSNTISGNARREFGDQFMLTVPIVLKGKSESVRVSDVVDIYVIPIHWRNTNANLIINFCLLYTSPSPRD